MAESKDELKSFLFKVIEESKNFVLKLNIQKIRPWQIAVEIMETETNFILGSSKITAGADYSHEIKRCLFLERKAVTNLDSIYSCLENPMDGGSWVAVVHGVTQSRTRLK